MYIKEYNMWGNNYNKSSNSFIWLILLILIFFNNGSSISEADYFRLTDSTNNTNNLLNNLFN